MRRRRHRTAGQAIVEFALAATLIFFLLSAAVDLGLLFFSLQAVRAAAQEGATFGRVPVQVLSNNKVSSIELDYEKIIQRIRTAAGEPSVGLVNLHDLDNNGQDDVSQGIVPNPNTNRNTPVTTGPIRIDNPLASNPNNFDAIGLRQCSTNVANEGMRNRGINCWVRVQIQYTYRFFFPIAPVFGNTVTFPVTYSIQIKSEYAG